MMSPTVEAWTRRANAVADALDAVAPGPVHRAMIGALAAEMTNDGKAGPDVWTQMLDLAADVPYPHDPKDDDVPRSALTYLCDAADALEGRAVESPDPSRYDPVPAVVLDALAALTRLYPFMVGSHPAPAPRSPSYTGAEPWCPMCPDTAMECPHDPAERDLARSKIGPEYFARFGLI